LEKVCKDAKLTGALLSWLTQKEGRRKTGRRTIKALQAGKRSPLIDAFAAADEGRHTEGG